MRLDLELGLRLKSSIYQLIKDYSWVSELALAPESWSVHSNDGSTSLVPAADGDTGSALCCYVSNVSGGPAVSHNTDIEK